MTANALARLENTLAAQRGADLVKVGGHVVEVSPNLCRAVGLSKHVALGDRVAVGAAPPLVGEITRIDPAHVAISLYERGGPLTPGVVVMREGMPTLSPTMAWRGRTLDALGRPIDGRGPLEQGSPRALDAPPPPAMTRERITTPIRTGVRVVDVFTPLCAGQRIGIFAGSGVGKSTMLAMLARTAGFDTIVVALVGERGREVREFLEGPLSERQANTVAIVATADESAMMRRLAARTATTVAEFFRDAGQSVLLIVDSVTRYAQAAREIGLATGEPAVARGFPPSVFGDLPKLLERAGPGPVGAGTITALFAVLVDGDDHNDPIADAIRGTLDGHIVLDRGIADSGRWPAIDLLRSLSRLSHLAWSRDESALVTRLRAMISLYEETRDLRAMGGYTKGSDPSLDQAVAAVPRVYAALAQAVDAPRDDAPFQTLQRILA